MLCVVASNLNLKGKLYVAASDLLLVGYTNNPPPPPPPPPRGRYERICILIYMNLDRSIVPAVSACASAQSLGA